MKKLKKLKPKKLTKDVLFGKNLKQTIVLIIPKKFQYTFDKVRKDFVLFEKESNSKILAFATSNVSDIEVSLIYRHKTKKETLDLIKKKFNNNLQILK